MAKEKDQSTDITKEQMSDVYTAGTSDGMMMTQEGLIQIKQDGQLDENIASEHKDEP